MAVTIGIFEKEIEVQEAIRLLREAGAEQDDIRVVVNNKEGAPILASDRDIHLEELYAIQEIHLNGDDWGLPLGAAPIAAGYLAGNISMSPGPAAVAAVGLDFDNGPSRKEVLQDIGIPGKAAEKCRKAVEAGHFVLVADTDSEINAQCLLSHAGANVVS